MKRLLLTLFITGISSIGLFAQDTQNLSTDDKKKINDGMKILSNAIGNQKTANSKDILSSFFRVGVDNLLGKSHNFTVSPTLFAIDSLFRGKNNPIPYDKERQLRRHSLTLLLTGDSLNNIKKFSAGATISVLNKTDITTNEFIKSDRDILLNTGGLVDSVKKGLMDYFAKKKIELSDIDFHKNWTEATKAHDFSKLSSDVITALKDPDFKNFITKINGSKSPGVLTVEDIRKSIIKGKDAYNDMYKKIAEKYAHKAIWTISPLAAYDRQTEQGEFTFASNFTVGLGIRHDKKPLELEVKAKFTIGNDTIVTNTNYRNQPLVASIGLNKVLLENDQNESRMEFKFFTQYEHQFGSAAKVTDKELFSLNTTLRINVFKSLWLPLTIKYDPKNANVFGYFSFTANLGN
jgi:hypothetical protein